MFFFSFLRKTFFFPVVVAFAITFDDYFLFLAWRLLLGDRRATRSLTSTGIGVRALTTHRQSPAMTQSTISADVHQTLDVHLDALAQIAFDLALGLEHGANPAQIVFTQILDPNINVHIRLFEN